MTPFDGTEQPDDRDGEFARALAGRPWIWAAVTVFVVLVAVITWLLKE